MFGSFLRRFDRRFRRRGGFSFNELIQLLTADRNSLEKIYDYNGKKNICGDRLREARVVRRLRQEDLAAQIQLKGINMERDSISRIEIGTRFVSDFELKIFAEVLGVSVQWLLGIDE